MEEIFNLDPDLEEQLWAKVMAQEMLRYAKTTSEKVMALCVDSEAVRILSQIKRVLDDPALDDPECFCRIDAIVSVFYQAGLSTRRHEECE